MLASVSVCLSSASQASTDESHDDSFGKTVSETVPMKADATEGVTCIRNGRCGDVEKTAASCMLNSDCNSLTRKRVE